MKAIICEPKKRARVTDISCKLESLHDTVGGYIELINIDGGALVVCNDEGKINGSLPCRGLYNKDGEMIDVLFGTFIILGEDIDGEFTSLTDNEVKKYLEIYGAPERLVYSEGKYEMIKLQEDM